jgi:hypothetical protein
MQKKKRQLAFKVGNTVLYATPIPEKESYAAWERIHAKTKHIGPQCKRRGGLAAIAARNIIFNH